MDENFPKVMWPPKLHDKLMEVYEQQMRYEVRDNSG